MTTRNYMTQRISIGLVFLALLVTTQTKGQQYPVFSQYYFNELVINPAYAGAHVQLSLNATYRNQWVNFPGAPQTVSFTGHTSLFNAKVGVGLLVNNDKIGSYDNQNIYGYYSYKIRFVRGSLAMGLQAGFNLLQADYSKLDLVDPSDPSFAPLNTFKPNFGAGLYYSEKNWFIGFSVPFILNNGMARNVEAAFDGIREARYYFLRGGSIFPINAQETVKFNPSILVRSQEGQPLSMDVNAGFIFYDAMSVGASLRSGDAFITFVDFKLSEKFHFAYSYDWTSSSLNRFSNGSHEFMLNYRAKVSKGHRSIPCPTYYNYNTLEKKNIRRSKRYNTVKRRT
jgi:type IX secretion system PorP/SprF family membrane protein